MALYNPTLKLLPENSVMLRNIAENIANISPWHTMALYNPTLKLLPKNSVMLGNMAENIAKYFSMTHHGSL